MVKLIQKSGFIKPGKAAGYIKYIATRDGVEMIGPEGYMEYMATRPGSHGLFSSQPDTDLNAVMKEVEQHAGLVWTLIYSLHREDAARLGYDSAASWRQLIKAHQVELANAMKIPPERFRWCAAYHDEGEHPATVRKRLQTVLERAGCKKIRFHDLRHTFSTVSLEHGMDVKTLSTVIGHVSSSTTLNVYAHVTDEMRKTAAIKIDQGIGRVDPQAMAETAPRKPAPSTFQAHKGQRRKAGTGCVTQINEKLWEGRYSPIWPDGKKHARNVYAPNEEDCEKLLAELIAGMKAEISVEKERLKTNPKAG